MLERAARPTEARPTLPREASRQPGAAKEVRGAPDRWWSWGGGRGERPRTRAFGRSAPRAITTTKELTEEWLWSGSAPPNGSRLSCGRNTRGRKALERQTKRLAGEATQFFPTCERPAASSAC